MNYHVLIKEKLESEVKTLSISNIVNQILEKEGRTQRWVVTEMNRIDPTLKMDRVKFSAIVCDKRKMTGDELLAFCKAMQINPDIFMEKKVG